MRPLAAFAALLLSACSDSPPSAPQVAGAAATVDFLRGSDWPSYHRDLAGTRFSPLDQISPTNVDELRQAWSYSLGPAVGGSELTPLVVDGVLYAAAADRVVALQAESGAELWRFPLERGAPSRRGIAYWSGDDALAPRIFFTSGQTLVALDARTGRKAEAFGAAGAVQVAAPSDAAPTLFDDLIVVGAAGGVRAYDARTGAERWTFTGDGASLHPAFSLTVDVDRALLYAVFAGPTRDADDVHANAIVALDAHTGAARWHFQTVQHAVWEHDLVAPPALLDVDVGRDRVPVLAQAGRTGYLYVLNRVTGKPVFEIVGTAIRPIPSKPPPLARVTYAPADLVTAADTTAEHAERCRALLEAPRSTIVFPGSLGGSGWGGVAADPRRGIVFVNTSSEGGIGGLEAGADAVPARFAANAAAAGATSNEQRGGSLAWPCQKPPWGELTAVDVSSGEVVWRVPLGATEQLAEGRRRTGRLNLGGPIVTAGGLVFIGATNDRRFRAFDARTGAELWVTELPLSAHAVPITYAAADGRQYVAIVAAGQHAMDDRGAADAQSLISYALP